MLPQIGLLESASVKTIIQAIFILTFAYILLVLLPYIMFISKRMSEDI